MLKTRIIPCLDVGNGRVGKGVNFVDLIDAGDPVEAAKAYDAAGADELCFLDIMATEDNRATMYDLVTRTAEQCFMPLTVGGGVRPPDDVLLALLVGQRKGHEVPADAHQQVGEAVGLSLGLAEGLGTHHVDLEHVDADLSERGLDDGFEAVGTFWDARSHARNRSGFRGSMEVQPIGQFIKNSTQSGFS